MLQELEADEKANTKKDHTRQYAKERQGTNNILKGDNGDLRDKYCKNKTVKMEKLV